jgi:nucleoside 2-deoxyribosyltransferase
MSNKVVYLSGPITGLTYREARFGWRKKFMQWLDGGITVLSPMRHEGHLAEMKSLPIEPDNLPTHLFSHPKMIVTKDFLDIDACTIMVVNLLEAQKVSQGTLIEYGYARAKGKTIITVSDVVDAVSIDKIHNSPFLGVISDVIVPTLKDAAIIVNSLLSEGV